MCQLVLLFHYIPYKFQLYHFEKYTDYMINQNSYQLYFEFEKNFLCSVTIDVRLRWYTKSDRYLKMLIG